MNKEVNLLGERLGMTMHVSPLRLKLRSLLYRYNPSGSTDLDDWLVDVANARGARIVFREPAQGAAPVDVPRGSLSDEELVVAVCQLQCKDRPQMLRLAAQLISRKVLNVKIFCLIAERERVGPVLAALAELALKVDPKHEHWLYIQLHFAGGPKLRDTLLHWTRIAEPVMIDGRCNAREWRLVA